jgi:hypothetical protein
MDAARMSVDDVDRRQGMMLRNTPQMHVQEEIKGGRSSVCQPASSGGHGASWLAAAGAAVLRGALFFSAMDMEGLTHVKMDLEKVVLLMGMQCKMVKRRHMCQMLQ